MKKNEIRIKRVYIGIIIAVCLTVGTVLAVKVFEDSRHITEEHSRFSTSGVIYREDALLAAEAYNRDLVLSRAQLIELLKRDGFSEDNAAYAADSCNVDYTENALIAAEAFLNRPDTPKTKKCLTSHLIGEGYTEEQADNAAAEMMSEVNWR